MKKTAKVFLIISGFIGIISSLVRLISIFQMSLENLRVEIHRYEYHGINYYSPLPNTFYNTFIPIEWDFEYALYIFNVVCFFSVIFSILSAIFSFKSSGKKKISLYITNIVLSSILLLINLFLFFIFSLSNFSYFISPIPSGIIILPFALVGSIIGLNTTLKERKNYYPNILITPVK